MRVYSVNSRWGYYLGRYFQPTWERGMPIAGPTIAPAILGFHDEHMQEYFQYLWRLGAHTFGALYVTHGGTVGGRMNAETFALFHILKLWPVWGKLWRSVGGTPGAFQWRSVHWRDPAFPLYQETENWPANQVIFRYRDELWRGRVLSIDREGYLVILLYYALGVKLMFELRGTGKAKRYQDKWNFGMTMWEVRDIAGRKHLYLWGGASVTYIGMATRLEDLMFRVKVLGARTPWMKALR